MADRHWGKSSEFSYAWRSIADTGTVLAFGSDAPVKSPNPFAAIHAAVTRFQTVIPTQMDGTRSSGSPWEALNGFTDGPAYASTRRTSAGKLYEGYFADLIVLEEDPFCYPNNVAGVKTSATMVGGKWVGRDSSMTNTPSITPEILVPKLGDYLVKKGHITREQLVKSLRSKKN